MEDVFIVVPEINVGNSSMNIGDSSSGTSDTFEVPESIIFEENIIISKEIELEYKIEPMSKQI